MSGVPPRWSLLSKEEILEAYESTNTLTAFCKKLGYKSVLTKEKLQPLFEKYNLDSNHFNYHAGRDITNQVFGYLKAIEVDTEKTKETGRRYWKCECLRCNRHKIVSVRLSNLVSGEIKSCGCLKGNQYRDDITNKVFGYLKVIEIDEAKSADLGKTHWKCQCLRCGNPNLVSVSATHLKTGHTKSCGCLNSVAEDAIAKILAKNNYDYKQQYYFDDLRGTTGLLRFDFAIFKNDSLLCLIEYNGIQHYEPRSGFGGEEALNNQIYRDNKKVNYCRENNIPLIILNKETGYEESIILNELNKIERSKTAQASGYLDELQGKL